MKRVLLSALALIVVGLVFVSHLTASQSWIVTGNLPQARSTHQAFLLADGRVFVAGETDTGLGVPMPAAFYNPATGTWAAAPTPLLQHLNAMAVRLSDGRIMFAGGRGADAIPRSNVEIFDPVMNAWQATGQLARGRILGTLTLLQDGRVLLAGGYSLFGFDNTAEVWDPATNAWTMTQSMAVGRWQHTATLLNDGRVLVAGGEQYGHSGGDDLNNVEIFNPASGTWSIGPSMAIRRASHSAVRSTDGRVIVMGGVSGAPTIYNVTTTIEIYDAPTNSWSFGASMPTGRADSAPLVAMPDGTFIAVGGQIAFNPAAYTAAVDRYNPVTDSWSPLPSMNTARTRHTATLVANGDILAAGGSNVTVANLNSAERLVTLPPVTTATPSLGPNGNGWNNTNVTITLNATTSIGSVQSITYSLDGAQSGGATVAGNEAVVLVTAEGSTTITFHATDNAGNVESDQSLTLKIDKTLPLVNVPNDIVAPATVSGGAFINFVAGGSDGLSGLVSTVTAPLFSGQLFPVTTTHETVTLTDAAGNVAIGGFDVTVVPGRPFTSINGGTFLSDGNSHPAMASVTQGNGNAVAGNISVGYLPGGINAPVQPGQYSAALSFTSNDPAFTNVFPWNGVATDPVARHAATAGVINGKMYVVGGHPFGDPAAAFAALLGNYAYDPAANTWTQRAAPPFARNFAAGDVIDDKLYIAGGCIESNCNLATNVLAAYDPAGNTWATLTPAPLTRNLMAGGAINGKLYLAGGAAPYDPTNGLQVYDPATDTWSLKANMPQPSHSAAAAVFGDKLYVIGGYDAVGPTRRVQVYDPSSNSWSMRAPAPSIQIMPAAAVINNRIYVFGGSDGAGNSVTTVQSYDPNSDTWSLEPSLPTQRYALVAGAINGRVYVSGGSHQPSQVTGITEGFDPSLTTHITILNETIAPTSNHVVAPPNFSGWNNTNVPVTINAFDNSSGVQSISYSLSGAQNGNFSVDGAVAAFTITGEGPTTVTYHATDNAGNVENDHSFVVKIDKTAPAASLALDAAANANGWHKISPNVQINSFDNAGGSGVQSIAYTLNGAQNVSFGSFTSFSIFNQGVTAIAYHAIDQAGNAGADQFFTVQYDQQQPVIDPIADITVTATSSLGATVSYPAPTASDSTSGIDTITVSQASGTMFHHGQTQVTVAATDMAGNQATRTFRINVNKALVSISVLPDTATIDQGQSQFFQAQGTFTDNSTAILPTANTGGGGGGGGVPQNTGTIWNIHFDDPINLSQCAPGTFSSQAISGSSLLPTTVDNLWGPTNSVIHATGNVSVAQVSLTLACVNGQGAPGSLSADWTGTRYEGTWNLSGTSGHVTVRGWSPKAPAPTARFSIGAATVNGVVYVMGRDNPSAPSPVEAYDIANDSWSSVSAMPTSREGAAYVALNGKIYAAGGHVSGGFGTNTMDIYDPSTNTWSNAASMSMVRAQFALVAGSDGKLYAIGGETGANGAPVTNSVEAYDPISNTWSAQPSMVTARRYHVAAAVNNGALIVVSGGNQSPTSTTELYDVVNHAWSNGPAPQSTIDGARAVVINNSMFVVGGNALGGTSRVQMFRPANGINPAGWAVPGDMPTPRGQLALAAAGGTSDVLYAIGGLLNGASVTTVEAMSTPPPTDLQVSAGTGGGGGGGFTLPTATFTSTNTAVAMINGSGQASGNTPGQTTIVATANGISSETTGTSALLTVVNPECANVVITVTAVGQLPFNTLPAFVEGEDGSFEIPFGPNHLEIEPGTFVLHLQPPAGYKATPNPLIVVASCEAPVTYEIVVEALDTTAPSLTVSPNLTAEATSAAGAIVTFAAPSAIDGGSGVASVSCDRQSPDQFPIGTTTVHCEAFDHANNHATASFDVSVVDTTRPRLTLPSNIVTYATSPIGAAVSFTATAVDAVDGATTVTCTPPSGSTFVIGVTTVPCSSSDAHDNTASGSFTVTVLSAAQIVGDLIGDIDNFQQANGILNNVLNSLTSGNTGAACSQLGAFINQVQAQTGKKLTQAEADSLLQIANAAKAAIGCP